MGLLDDLKGMAFQGAEGGAQNLIGGAVEKAIPGGVEGLMSKLEQGGLGEQVKSWVGDGHNLPVSTDQLQSVLGDQHVQEIAQHLGVDPQQVLQGLSEHLPGLAAKSASE